MKRILNNPMDKYQILQEAYEAELIEEGFFDRAKAGISGAATSITNIPKKAINAVKAGTAAAAGNAEGATKAAQANAQMRTGKQKRQEVLLNAHRDRLSKEFTNFENTLKELSKDLNDDMVKSGIFTDEEKNAQIMSQWKNITNSITNMVKKFPSPGLPEGKPASTTPDSTTP